MTMLSFYSHATSIGHVVRHTILYHFTHMAASQSTNLSPIEVRNVELHTDTQTHSPSSTLSNGPVKLDIEHTLVDDDPRLWSNTKKTAVLLIISGVSMFAGLAMNIQNPTNAQIEQQLHTTSGEISLSLSLFILVQGNCPIIWSVISEIKGRKLVTIGLVIGMQIVQGAGSSAVWAIGAATLADIYEPHQCGTMMGIYYSAPLLGPSLGPILGGALTQGLSWRAVFWFLVIWGGIIFLAFLFLFKDTFRKERSVTYQNMLKRRLREQLLSEGTDKLDIEAQMVIQPSAIEEVKLTIADVNPFPPYWSIVSRMNNLVILTASGDFSITYTCARTLSMYYNYDALKTGLVLLAYGIGCVSGSILGGRWSDRTLARLKATNGGVSFPEMRLESTKIAMLWLPLSVIGYAWVCQEQVHIAAVCVILFLAGLLSVWIYSSTLAYLVDANIGCSSMAVATNSSFRGISAFVAAEIAVPLQDSIGDGGLYTLWACVMVFIECMILLVLYKGRKWREASVEREKQNLDAN
ncbi:vacuolar DHA amino acid exporter [Suillus clintonianus]|uniref:vacuolar DHA amino acid exporter n=1 Tax=Suillus clintonianus TaxID=1904413 RepID=UPI001B86A3D1|nr:vacuolar DHA amino acid exporter [Suillus clintonianus]KAG2144555.1 vacuolar DHA amino acid exporter [Suillus clintonianus]